MSLDTTCFIIGASVIAVFGLFIYMKRKTERRAEERRLRLEEKQEELMKMLREKNTKPDNHSEGK